MVYCALAFSAVMLVYTQLAAQEVRVLLAKQRLERFFQVAEGDWL